MVGRYFHPRANLVVPNVSWGMGIHECDLLVATKAGYLLEVEIKVTKADLIRDALKWHQHRNDKIKHLWFAIPSYLEDCIEHIPERAGIITVSPPKNDGWLRQRVRKLREPQTNKAATPITERERYMLARLGALRIWGLKDKLLKRASGE